MRKPSSILFFNDDEMSYLIHHTANNRGICMNHGAVRLVQTQGRGRSLLRRQMAAEAAFEGNL